MDFDSWKDKFEFVEVVLQFMGASVVPDDAELPDLGGLAAVLSPLAVSRG